MGVVVSHEGVSVTPPPPSPPTHPQDWLTALPGLWIVTLLLVSLEIWISNKVRLPHKQTPVSVFSNIDPNKWVTDPTKVLYHRTIQTLTHLVTIPVLSGFCSPFDSWNSWLTVCLIPPHGNHTHLSFYAFFYLVYILYSHDVSSTPAIVRQPKYLGYF